MVIVMALALAVLTAPSGTPVQAGSQPALRSTKPLTNADVVSMSKAGLSDPVIIGTLQQASTSDLDVSPEALIALKSAGVSDRVIEAMQTRQNAQPAAPNGLGSEPCRVFVTEEEPPSRSYVVVRKEIQVGKKFYGSQDDKLMEDLATDAAKAGADAIIKFHEWRAPSMWSWAAAKAGGMAVKWTSEGKSGVAELKGQCWKPRAEQPR